jgi:hypothetical protein
MTTFNLSSLEDVLEYKNENILYSFMERFDLPFEEITDIYMETHKWLWLCAKAQYENVGVLHVNKDLRIIDQAWHTFILYTVEYDNFCKKYLGKFIHHLPTTYREKLLFYEKVKQPDYLEGIKSREDKLYEYVLNNLGRDTLYKWFIDYPKKYPSATINSFTRETYPIIFTPL